MYLAKQQQSEDKLPLSDSRGDQATEYNQKESDLFKSEDIFFDKELEGVSKQNHQVDVIKKLKDKKNKGESLQDMPLLRSEVIQIKKEKKEQIFLDKKAEQTLKSVNHDKVQEVKKESQVKQEELKVEKQVAQKQLQSTCTIFTTFSQKLRSSTIQLEQQGVIAVQKGQYWQNFKLILTEPIKTQSAMMTIKVQNLKYCVGAGIAIKQVIENHSFDYKSHENQLSHGLYIVTSQGYAWSHHLKEQDDILHEGFNLMKTNDSIQLYYDNGQLNFKMNKFFFSLSIPSDIVQKYTLCFCAYLHQKEDSMRIKPVTNMQMQIHK